MKIITYEDIKRLDISPESCYNWVSEIIINKNNTILPPKISLSSSPGMFMNTMPCILDNEWGGIKVINRYPNRIPSLDSKLLLIDNSTGDFLALMDSNWITAMRTGAVAAHSILLLAKSNWNNIAFLGLGNTCRATLLVLATILKNRKIHVKLYNYKDQQKSFVERFKNFNNLEFEFVETYQQLISGSDVVVSCATYLDNDICEDKYFEEGILVVPVHTRGFTNCDLFFDKVYADDYGHVCHFKNFNKFKFFAEVNDVVNGNIEGRINNKERILSYNIGLSIHDIFFAKKIYEMINDKNHSLINNDIDMQCPKEKFWI